MSLYRANGSLFPTVSTRSTLRDDDARSTAAHFLAHHAAGDLLNLPLGQPAAAVIVHGLDASHLVLAPVNSGSHKVAPARCRWARRLAKSGMARLTVRQNSAE